MSGAESGSSISSSDARPVAEEPWRRFALSFVAAAAVLLGGILGAAYAIDPYDTGRSSLVHKPGVRPQGPRTAGASRGRDPAFNAAIIGNSHVQLLSPERLDALTGLFFVQLTVPATGPKEQLVLIDWFMRHHPGARAIVIGADDRWCTADPALPNAKPFPFWLYSRDALEYARGLLRYGVLEELAQRFRYVFSARPARARPDGYWDYEPHYQALGFDRDPALRHRLERRVTGSYIANATGRFPAAARLRQVAESLPPQTAIVVVFPPIFAQLLPAPGSPGDLADEACKAALAEAAASRGNGAVVDWRRERPETQNPAWFFDQTHYRHPIAELVEKDVARSIAELARRRGGYRGFGPERLLDGRPHAKAAPLSPFLPQFRDVHSRCGGRASRLYARPQPPGSRGIRKGREGPRNGSHKDQDRRGLSTHRPRAVHERAAARVLPA